MYKEAASLHQTYRLDLDKVLAKKKGTTEEIEKKTKDENRKAERHRKSSQKGKEDFFQPVTKLSFSNKQGTHYCYTQKDIAAVCIVEKKRLSQSRSTQPMKASLIERVGYNAEKEAEQQILDGPAI